MSNKQEIWMERTHGRARQCKTEFKGVVNKMLVSTLILTTMLGATTPAFAAEMPRSLEVSTNSITQEYGISVEAAVSNIKNTINSINQLRASGKVSDSTLYQLATQIQELNIAVKSAGGEVGSDVISILEKAETTASKFSGKAANTVLTAVAIARKDMGITDTIVVKAAQRQAGNVLKSFKDVPSSHWAHNAIMDMVGRGMFAGTTAPDANGVGTFAPDAPMTRAQFITVITRYLFADTLNNTEVPPGSPWYMGNYIVAIDKGILKTSEFAMDDLNVPMTRQEMAMVLVRAMESKGEDWGTTIPNSRIPDYSKIGTYYRSYVKVAYTEGLIAGTDAKGTFNPMGTLTRAQAATVIYRLVEESTRNPINVAESIVQESVNIGQESGVKENTNVQTWVEGQKHDMPKEGDIIITADGVKHTITRDPISGVLGGGLNVDYDIWAGYTGLGNPWTDARGNTNYGYVHGYDNGITGRDQTSLIKDHITGVTHTSSEWAALSKAYYLTSSTKGSYEGEIRNNWFRWEDNGWTWIGPSRG